MKDKTVLEKLVSNFLDKPHSTFSELALFHFKEAIFHTNQMQKTCIKFYK